MGGRWSRLSDVDGDLGVERQRLLGNQLVGERLDAVLVHRLPGVSDAVEPAKNGNKRPVSIWEDPRDEGELERARKESARRENKPKRCSECGSGKSGGEGAAHAAGDLPSAFRRRTRRKLNSRHLTFFSPPATLRRRVFPDVTAGEGSDEAQSAGIGRVLLMFRAPFLSPRPRKGDETAKAF